jgi:hypothetical protein
MPHLREDAVAYLRTVVGMDPMVNPAHRTKREGYAMLLYATMSLLFAVMVVGFILLYWSALLGKLLGSWPGRALLLGGLGLVAALRRTRRPLDEENVH